MKKLSLKLLFSSIVLINAYATDVVVTTTLGPIDLVVNTTKTPTDGNAYNTVTLGGTINIGDTTTGNITLASSVFNAAVSALGVNEFVPLTLHKNSLLHAGQLTQLGNAGDNIISCQSANRSNNPDITLTAVEGTGGLKRHIELMDCSSRTSIGPAKPINRNNHATNEAKTARMALVLAERSKELICNWKPDYHITPPHGQKPGGAPKIGALRGIQSHR